jgi:PhnB protein
MNDWIVPYLTFDGTCEEAVAFYQKVLGGESQILHYGDTPHKPEFDVPAEMNKLVLHAELRKEGHVLRFSDSFSQEPLHSGNNISFSLELPSAEETTRVFREFAQEGKVEMALQQTFFSPLYGKVTDKYGISWLLTTGKA